MIDDLIPVSSVLQIVMVVWRPVATTGYKLHVYSSSLPSLHVYVSHQGYGDRTGLIPSFLT